MVIRQCDNKLLQIQKKMKRVSNLIISKQFYSHLYRILQILSPNKSTNTFVNFEQNNKSVSGKKNKRCQLHSNLNLLSMKLQNFQNKIQINSILFNVYAQHVYANHHDDGHDHDRVFPLVLSHPKPV